MGLTGQQAGKRPRERPGSYSKAVPPATPPSDLASGPGLVQAEASSCSHVWEGYEKKTLVGPNIKQELH